MNSRFRLASIALAFLAATPALAGQWVYTFQSAQLFELPDPFHAGAESKANDINIHGQIVGWAHTSAAVPNAWLLEVSGVYKHVGIPVTTEFTIASGINNVGEVVGTWVTGNVGRGFHWHPSPTMAGWRGSKPPRAIAASAGSRGKSAMCPGQPAAGRTASSSGESTKVAPWQGAVRVTALTEARALYWDGTSEASQLLGVLPGGKHSRAFDLNDEHFVTGCSERPLSTETGVIMGERAFLWNSQIGMVELPASGGIPAQLYEYCRANALANYQSTSASQGVIRVVGYCGKEKTRAVRWDVTVSRYWLP